MDAEMFDGIRFLVAKENAEHVLVTSPKLSGETPGSFVDKHEQDILNKVDEVASELLKATDQVEISINGYKELIPLFPDDLCPKHDARDGFVYLISDGRAVKIGKSDAPEKRYTQLQTGNPFKLVVLQELEVKDMARVEYSLHYWYRRHRLIGEWFDLLPLFGLSRVDYLEAMLGANTVRHEHSYSINVFGQEKSQCRRIWIRNPDEIKARRKNGSNHGEN